MPYQVNAQHIELFEGRERGREVWSPLSRKLRQQYTTLRITVDDEAGTIEVMVDGEILNITRTQWRRVFHDPVHRSGLLSREFHL